MKNKQLRLKPLAISTGIALFLFSTAFIANNVRGTFGNRSASDMQAENDYLASLRVDPKTGEVPQADYMRALSEVNKMQKASLTKGANTNDFTWEICGPDDVAGRMRALVEFNGYLYAGSPDGGIWRTAKENSSFVWNKISTDFYNVSCMYTDGTTLYVGTGEGFYSESFNLLPGFKGTGLYSTTDGENFTLIEGTSDWFYISKIAKSGSTIYVATSEGLKKSNGDGTWSTMIEGDCSDVTSAGNYTLAFVDSLPYRSANGGNFEVISNLPQDSIGRITFAIAPTDQNIVYATAICKYDNPDTKDHDEIGTLYNIYRSDDAGVNWHIIGPGNGWTMFYVFNGNGLYSTAMLVDPNNANRLYVGGMDLWEGNKVEGNEIFQWTQRTSAENYSSLAYVPQNHFQYYYLNGGIYIACENGIYSSFKVGNLLSSSSHNINLITSQFYTVAGDYAGGVMGGSQGNGTVVINEASFSGMSGSNMHITLGSLTGNDYTFNNIGGYCHYSQINPNGRYFSINGNHDLKDESMNAYADFGGDQYLILYRYDGQVPQTMSYWYDGNYYKAIEDSASYITPSILWEDFDWEYSTDVVYYKDTVYHPAGDTVYAKSVNANYPIEVVLENDLHANDSIEVIDNVASRFFVGVNNLIFMTKHATNFNKDFENNKLWWIISSGDMGGVTGTPQCMAVSKDCNYLFVGTKEGRLYKISNLAYAQDDRTANACSYDATFSTISINPYCVVNTTELEIPSEGRVITSIAVHPEDPNKIVVTLGSYGYDNYIYVCDNAISENPTFTAANFSVKAPVYTSAFIENDEAGLENLLLIGTDFGIFENIDIFNNGEFTKEDAGMGNVPVFMIKQQNIAPVTKNDAGEYVFKPVYYNDYENETTDTTYTASYRNIYVATFGGGLYKNTRFNVKADKNTNEPTGFADLNDSNLNKVSVYPNPVADNANICVNTTPNTNVTINIYDMKGSLVNSMTRNSGNGELSCSLNAANLPMGTYIVKVNTVTGISSSKFIVVK